MRDFGRINEEVKRIMTRKAKTIRDNTCEYLDVAGMEIGVGSYVVYAASLGQSNVLKFGKVTKLVDRENRGGDVVSYEPTVRLVTVERDWRGGWNIQKNGKAVALDRMHTILVITEGQVPPMAKRLLDGEEVREDGSPRSGFHRITQRGRDFAHGRVVVPKYVHVYNGEYVNVFSDETISIEQALGEAFDYRELMGR